MHLATYHETLSCRDLIGIDWVKSLSKGLTGSIDKVLPSCRLHVISQGVRLHNNISRGDISAK